MAERVISSEPLSAREIESWIRQRWYPEETGELTLMNQVDMKELATRLETEDKQKQRTDAKEGKISL